MAESIALELRNAEEAAKEMAEHIGDLATYVRSERTKPYFARPKKDYGLLFNKILNALGRAYDGMDKPMTGIERDDKAREDANAVRKFMGR